MRKPKAISYLLTGEYRSLQEKGPEILQLTGPSVYRQSSGRTNRLEGPFQRPTCSKHTGN